MNLAATEDNIILRPIMASDKSVGGIVLPGARGFEDGAVIISIGPDVNRLVVGDIVVRPDPPRYTVSDDNTGEIYLICAEVDILAKILPEESMRLEGENGSVIEGVKSGNYTVGIGDRAKKIVRVVTQEELDAADQADKTEEAKEEAGVEEGEVYVDGIPCRYVDPLLSLRPYEGLPKDDRN